MVIYVYVNTVIGGEIKSPSSHVKSDESAVNGQCHCCHVFCILSVAVGDSMRCKGLAVRSVGRSGFFLCCRRN